MFATLFGIGFKALAGKALGVIASGISSAAKGVWNWAGKTDTAVRLIVIVLIVGLVADHVGLVMAHRHSAKVEKQLTAANAALVSARKDLATSKANEKTLGVEIAKQNASIAALGQKSAQAQNAAAIARKAADERANDAERTAEALRQSAASTGLKTSPACEPSDELKRRWPS